MAPRINQLSTQKLGGEPLLRQHVTSAQRIPSPINAFFIQHLPVSCVGQRGIATLAPQMGLLRLGRDMERPPKPALEPPAVVTDSHLNASPPERQ